MKMSMMPPATMRQKSNKNPKSLKDKWAQGHGSFSSSSPRRIPMVPWKNPHRFNGRNRRQSWRPSRVRAACHDAFKTPCCAMGRCAGNVGAGEIGMDGVGTMGKFREKRWSLMQWFLMMKVSKSRGNPFWLESLFTCFSHPPYLPRCNPECQGIHPTMDVGTCLDITLDPCLAAFFSRKLESCSHPRASIQTHPLSKIKRERNVSLVCGTTRTVVHHEFNGPK